MNKFKRIFYLSYLLYFCFVGFIGYYYEDLVLRWEWDFIDTWAGLLRFVLKLSAFGLVLFLTEIIIENFQIFSLHKKIESLEKDIMALKGKLYDQSVTTDNEAADNNDVNINDNVDFV
jgi:hypothetical protein